MFDFDQICFYKSEYVCSFVLFFKAHIVNMHDVSTNSNYLFSKVLSLHCVFDVQNLVLCLTLEPLKLVDYKIMLRKIHLILPLLVKHSSKSNKN